NFSSFLSTPGGLTSTRGRSGVTKARWRRKGGRPSTWSPWKWVRKMASIAPGSSPSLCMWGSRGAPPSSSNRPSTTTAPLYRSSEKADPVPRKARSTAGNLHEGFGGQVPQMQGAAEHGRERIGNTRPSARRSGVPREIEDFVGWRWRRRRWGAWAPKHRGGFSAGLLGRRTLLRYRALGMGNWRGAGGV